MPLAFESAIPPVFWPMPPAPRAPPAPRFRVRSALLTPCDVAAAAASSCSFFLSAAACCSAFSLLLFYSSNSLSRLRSSRFRACSSRSACARASTIAGGGARAISLAFLRYGMARTSFDASDAAQVCGSKHTQQSATQVSSNA
eukprot:4222679-Pleurochrysis_carterae.AAC.3